MNITSLLSSDEKNQREDLKLNGTNTLSNDWVLKTPTLPPLPPITEPLAPNLNGFQKPSVSFKFSSPQAVTPSLEPNQPSVGTSNEWNPESIFFRKVDKVLMKFPAFFRQLQSREIKECLQSHLPPTLEKPPQQDTSSKFIDLTNEEKKKTEKEVIPIKPKIEVIKQERVIKAAKRKSIAKRKFKPSDRFTHSSRKDFFEPREIIPPSFEYGIQKFIAQKEMEEKIKKKEEEEELDTEEADVDVVEGFLLFCHSVGDNSEKEDDYEGEFREDRKRKIVRKQNLSHKGQAVDFVYAVVQAIRSLGGRATGSEITNWIAKNRKDSGWGDKRILGYRVNAVLSSKKHSNLFLKKKGKGDGKRNAIWKLGDVEISLSTDGDTESDSATEQDSSDQGEESEDEDRSERSDEEGEDTGDELSTEVSDYDRDDMVAEMGGCQVCNRYDNAEKILLCDSCDEEYHMYCLDPPLQRVPKGYWYCPKCKSKEDSREDYKKKKSDLEQLENFGTVDQIKEAIIAQGGRATGADICKWIAAKNSVPDGLRKTLQYRVNALLSGRSFFFKENILIEGTRRASVWRIYDPNSEPVLPKTEPLSETEVRDLVEGVRIFGIGHWTKVLEHFKFDNRTPQELENKWNAFSKAALTHEEEGEARSMQSCEVCHTAENENKTLLCDNCDREYHIYCLDPPLLRVPKGTWFCYHCRLNSDKDSPSGKRGDPESVNKVRAALQSLGGKSTGDKIIRWLLDNNLFSGSNPKAIKYKVNAILSSKSYTNYFDKEPIVGQKRGALWILKPSDDEIPSFGPLPRPQDDTTMPILEDTTPSSSIMKEELSSPLEDKTPPIPDDFMEVLSDDEPETDVSPAASRNFRHIEEYEVRRSPYMEVVEEAAVRGIDTHFKVCEVCQQGGNPNKVLLCDSCDKEYHMYCLEPALYKIPKGKWYCPQCRGPEDQEEEQSRDLDFVLLVKNTVEALGKFVSAVEIAKTLIDSGYAEEDELKLLKPRITAVLECKSYSDYFEKGKRGEPTGKIVNTWRIKNPSSKNSTQIEIDPKDATEECDNEVQTATPPKQIKEEKGEKSEDDQTEIMADDDNKRMSEVENELETLDEQRKLDSGAKICRICNAEAVVHSNHPERMTKFFSETKGFSGILNKEDWLCRSCYGYWYRETRGQIDVPPVVEDKSEKRGPGRPRKISAREMKELHSTDEDKPHRPKCFVCKLVGDKFELVACGKCEKIVHMSCFDPPLEEPPVPYYCEDCKPKRGRPKKDDSLKVRLGIKNNAGGDAVFRVIEPTQSEESPTKKIRSDANIPRKKK